MERPTKIVIGGIAAGLLTFGVGYIGYWHSNSRLIELVSECQAESLKVPWKLFKPDALVCDPTKLSFVDPDSPLADVQKEIVAQARKSNDWLSYTDRKSTRLNSSHLVISYAV